MHLEVDPTRLTDVAGTLRAVASDVGAVSGTMPVEAGIADSTAFDQGVEAFRDGVSASLGRLHDHLDELGRRLAAAAESYATTESELVDAATGG